MFRPAVNIDPLATGSLSDYLSQIKINEDIINLKKQNFLSATNTHLTI
jgi:hypothetical protein